MDAAWIKQCVQSEEYEFTDHAERERQADKLRIRDIEEALHCCEILENYPDDARGESCLVSGIVKRIELSMWLAVNRPTRRYAS